MSYYNFDYRFTKKNICPKCDFDINYYHHALCPDHPSKCPECGWNTDVYHRNDDSYHFFGCKIAK